MVPGLRKQYLIGSQRYAQPGRRPRPPSSFFAGLLVCYVPLAENLQTPPQSSHSPSTVIMGQRKIKLHIILRTPSLRRTSPRDIRFFRKPAGRRRKQTHARPLARSKRTPRRLLGAFDETLARGEVHVRRVRLAPDAVPRGARLLDVVWACAQIRESGRRVNKFDSCTGAGSRPGSYRTVEKAAGSLTNTVPRAARRARGTRR